MDILKRLVQIPFMFSLLNWAAVAGLYRYTLGHQDFWDVTEESRLPASHDRGAAR
jgi:hypothetical protein